MFWPCETRTSTCRSFATISSGLYRFLAIAVLLDVRDIPQVGPLQWGWITTMRWRRPLLGDKYHGIERCCSVTLLRRHTVHLRAPVVGNRNPDAICGLRPTT